MPTPMEILDGLAQIAQRWRMLAVIWHVYYGIVVAVLLIGVRPTKPVMGVALALPLFSVSVLAWLAANPFNGIVFAALGFVLMGLSLTLPREPVVVAPAWAVLAGGLMILFGWTYPHFTEASSLTMYLYAAPTGLIPCPTLSITIGLALVLGGLDTKAWPLVLTAAGLFYGLFGAFRLGVTIDLLLLVGAAALATAVFLPNTPTQIQRIQGAPDHMTGATNRGT